MSLYGLIGYPLSHSFSPAYFKEKFRREQLDGCEYRAFETESIDRSFLDALVDQGVSGFNVTIPYKEEIICYLDDLSEESAAIGAVNTVKVTEGRLVGYNTDVYGFEASLKMKDLNISKALILGSGGASKAVRYVLDKHNIAYRIVSRKRHYLSYEELDQSILESCQLVVNTTPLGMYPKLDQCPDIPYQWITQKHLVYDLIYNPEKTLFLDKAEKQSARIQNGLLMLELQAEKSWEIWKST